MSLVQCWRYTKVLQGFPQTTDFQLKDEFFSPIGVFAIRRLPPLNALKSFEAAARLGSFNQAAEELYVTPSAVSHQVKSLEDFLEIKLFRREKRQVLLTAAGEKYLKSIEHALDEIDSATRRLMAAPNAGKVNLSVAPAFLTRWLVPRLGKFQEQYPHVELRLTASTGLIDFAHSDTDMAVYMGDGNWRGVETHYLRNMVLVPVCSPRLLEGSKPLNEPKDLLRHNLIQVERRPHEWSQMLAQAGIHESPAQGLTFSNSSLAVGAAMEGVGIALADIQLVEREVSYGQLAIPFDLQHDTGKAFYLVYQKNRQLTHGMQEVRDWILSEMLQSTVTE